MLPYLGEHMLVADLLLVWDVVLSFCCLQLGLAACLLYFCFLVNKLITHQKSFGGICRILMWNLGIHVAQAVDLQSQWQ
jgi:hypothetical protein